MQIFWQCVCGPLARQSVGACHRPSCLGGRHGGGLSETGCLGGLAVVRYERYSRIHVCFLHALWDVEYPLGSKH